MQAVIFHRSFAIKIETKQSFCFLDKSNLIPVFFCLCHRAVE